MSPLQRRFALLVLESFVLMWGFSTTGAAQSGTTAADAAAVTTVANQFHQALERGDSVAATNLLAIELVVLESGEMEHITDYLAHHLRADITFAKAVHSTRVVQHVTVAGDAAWIVATSSASGTFKGRAVRSEIAELMVLRRSNGRWRIAIVHWSSHPART